MRPREHASSVGSLISQFSTATREHANIRACENVDMRAREHRSM